MLKFRHPFYQDMKPNFRKISEQLPYAKDFEVSKKYGIDFVTDAENKKLTYLTGITYIQPWAGIFSTEARHVTDSFDIQEHITLNEYEDKFYYYNNIERCYVKHQNDNADRSLGFDHCNDCALENYIWKQYIEKYRSTLNVKNLVKKLSAVTKRTLLREDHGHLF